MKNLLLLSGLLLLLPLPSLARGVQIEGNDARFLYKFAEKMRFDDDRPGTPDRADFLGGCFYTQRKGTLTRQFCECPIGRITSPDELLAIVTPHLKLRRFPDLDDRDTGTRGYALGIEFRCVRRPVIFWHEYLCELRDHFQPDSVSGK